MNPSRPVVTALATKTPRRRVRSATTPLVMANVPPARDLIGPPCPLSNLRPVYYAPLFPLLHNPSTWSTSFSQSRSSSPPSTSTSTSPPANPHPYSLSEFPSTAASLKPAQQHLSRLKAQLDRQDLEYRLARYRFDSFNQDFWVRMNSQFLESRDRYVVEQLQQLQLNEHPPRPRQPPTPLPPSETRSSSSSSIGEADSSSSRTSASASVVNRGVGSGGSGEDVDLAPFYAQHLAKTKLAYAEYNRTLWRMQAKLIGFATRDVVRRIRWNCAVWWAGGEK